jgi:hypothetical protein
MRRIPALLVFQIFPNLVWTHGGGLDGYGYHHNRKAGGYHCHRGVMAGQSFASKDEVLEAMRKQGKQPAPYGQSERPSTKQ